MKGIKIKNQNFNEMLKKLENKLRIEEQKENFEYCAYILNFKNVLEEFIKVGDNLSTEDINRFNLYLSTLELKSH